MIDGFVHRDIRLRLANIIFDNTAETPNIDFNDSNKLELEQGEFLLIDFENGNKDGEELKTKKKISSGLLF